jgi:hypothetical protein
MQIKTLSKKELELFYIGLMLGRELDVVEEYRTDDVVGFGDFEGINIQLCLKSHTLDFDHFVGDDSLKYYASIGVVHDACDRVLELLNGKKSGGE